MLLLRFGAQKFTDYHCSGNTPIDDAQREKRAGVIKIFGETQKFVERVLIALFSFALQSNFFRNRGQIRAKNYNSFRCSR